ncbi:MAG: sulfite exporter TauE/SafE family protein [Geminicoccaceae bacterium]|nr:MAG: sulfite exporter TauE/SafE family protein [Geminicoccaceae bacterium]
MDLYLPIAEMSVNALVVLALGTGVGFLSGVFGVGGGFLMTPLLLFIGIPAAVAVATQASQILASSVSGVLAHMRRQTVDFRMGWVLTIGGGAGSTLGVWLFGIFKAMGQTEFLVSVLYVLLLGTVGGLMLGESIVTWWRRRAGGPPGKTRKRDGWVRVLPFKMRFPRSQLYISALVPLAVGFFIGLLAAMMGVGGGFVMVPAMIYLIGMPTAVVIGTSLFQITFVTALTTYLHAVNNGTVDIILAGLLIVGGVIGAQWGSRVGAHLRGEQIRILLALLILGVAFKLCADLVIEPDDLYSLDRLG